MSRDIGDTNEMKMTGLILSQSALVGVAVGVYSSGLWLPTGANANSTINGMTYAMGALAVQTIAYYLFKMFFEQSMKEKVEVAEMQRNRQNMYRQQQMGFDQRRADLELRQMELQLEHELRLMQEDPSRIMQNEKMNKFFLNSLPCCASNFDLSTFISTLPELILFGFKGFSETLISFGVSILSVFSVKPFVFITLFKHLKMFRTIL